jgi:hypothetical protein
MGKFAGFLKRMKKVAGFGLDALNRVNNIYKSVKPFVSDVIDAVPFGNYINKGLDIGSKVLDKVTPLSSKLLTPEESKKSKKLSNKFERFAGKGVQFGLNKFLDTQENGGTSLSGLFGSTLN